MRPIHRIKHVVDTQGATAADTQAGQTTINAIDAPVLANTNEVETGCTVNGIYCHVEILWSTGTSIPNVYLAVFKNPGGNLTAPDANKVGVSDNKKYVIHQQMIMLQAQADPNPRVLFDGVIAIPKGYRRFGINDTLQVLVYAPGIAFDFCIQTIYKEFR